MKPAKTAAIAAELPTTAAETVTDTAVKATTSTRPRRARKPAAAPQVAPVAVTAEVEQAPPKLKRTKLIRDSYAMPSDEYAQLALLKQKALAAGVVVKKSELLRAALLALSHMTERNFLAALAKLPKPVAKKAGKKG